MKLTVSLISATILVGMTGIASAAVNTDYSLTMNLYPENTYAVVTHSNEYRGDLAWGDYYAPTGYPAPFYEFNGGTQASPLLRIFYGQDTLVNGDIYSFSTLAVDNYPVSAPVLQLSVDGILVGNSVTLGGPYGSSYVGTIGPWQRETFSFTATPGMAGSAVVALVDTNTAASGNDFSISGVPEPSTWALMLLGFAGLGFAGYRTSRKNAPLAV